MKDKKLTSLIVSVSAAILVVIIAATLGILQASGVLKANFTWFEIIFTVLTVGFGVICLVLGIVKKGGYETSIGMFLIAIGVVFSLIFARVYWVIVVIVAIALILITVLLTLLFNAKRLIVERADEKPDYVPYTEKIDAAKNSEEETPLPEIKSFKNNKK